MPEGEWQVQNKVELLRLGCLVLRLYVVLKRESCQLSNLMTNYVTLMTYLIIMQRANNNNNNNSDNNGLFAQGKPFSTKYC